LQVRVDLPRPEQLPHDRAAQQRQHRETDQHLGRRQQPAVPRHHQAADREHGGRGEDHAERPRDDPPVADRPHQDQKTQRAEQRPNCADRETETALGCVLQVDQVDEHRRRRGQQHEHPQPAHGRRLRRRTFDREQVPEQVSAWWRGVGSSVGSVRYGGHAADDPPDRRSLTTAGPMVRRGNGLPG
jgi:hypothetical protein